MKQGTRTILAWTFGILSGASLLLAAAGGVALAYQGKIAPNTYVGGVAVGGLAPNEANVLIRSQAKQIADTKIPLIINGKTKQASQEELGISLLPGNTAIFGHGLSGLFDWLKPSFWKNIFSPKNYPIAYEINKEQFLQTVEKKFGLHSTAQNAKLVIANGQLSVSPAVSGKQVDINPALLAISNQLISGQIEPLHFSYAETAATISTVAANQTKTEIVSLLKPVSLVGDKRFFTITVADQYELITYTTAGSKLNWEISEEKLRDYLYNRIAFQLNIRMIEKIIQKKPETVLQQGKDGRVVVMSALLSSVYRNITEQSSTNTITIPLQTIKYTERRVDADYIPNLFDVVYVDINLSKQKMTIVDGENALRTFIISSGRAGLPTPKGVFYVKNKIPLAQSRLYPGIWMRYWNALARNPDGSGYEGYGIHDLPCFNSSCTLIEGSSHLGSPVSHGCVRLGHDNAVWFYKNMPVGTPINIH